MLNVFPIQFLAPLAYALLRITVGTIFITLGVRHIHGRQSLRDVFTFSYFKHGLFFVWYMSLFEILIGTLFVLGFLTQIAAILALFLSLKMLIMHTRFNHPLIPHRLVYALLFVISLSLFITGAGIFAFDLSI